MRERVMFDREAVMNHVLVVSVLREQSLKYDTVTCEIYLRDEPHHTVTLVARSSARPNADLTHTREYTREQTLTGAGDHRDRPDPKRPPGKPGGAADTVRARRR